MIRIDAIWLSADLLDMRAGADRALTRVIEVFGNAKSAKTCRASCGGLSAEISLPLEE